MLDRGWTAGAKRHSVKPRGREEAPCLFRPKAAAAGFGDDVASYLARLVTDDDAADW